eukprot:3445198-Rhodomonas_salina.2
MSLLVQHGSCHVIKSLKPTLPPHQTAVGRASENGLSTNRHITGREIAAQSSKYRVLATATRVASTCWTGWWPHGLQRLLQNGDRPRINANTARRDVGPLRTG